MNSSTLPTNERTVQGFNQPTGFRFRNRGMIPNKDKPLVDRHEPKKSVGWLINDREGKIGRFTKHTPTAHAQWS